MKRLFFLLVLSVMITACHHNEPELIACPDANPTPKTEDIKNVEQPNDDCMNDRAINNSHSLNKIAVLGCPVK
ncbi:hypothetical protein A9G12_01050 [Gilliamella sp. wkB112]|nr:hypothetical protein A9G12_01050 [Gilliamella apicola]